MTFKYKIREKLSRASVSALVSDYDLLSYYVPEFSGFGKKVKSNIRNGGKDNDASLHFIYRGGRAIISDFGSSNVGLNVYEYLKLYLNVPDTPDGFLSLLERIRSDFKLPLEPYVGKALKVAKKPLKEAKIHRLQFEENTPWDIRYRAREWDSWEVDKEFWFDRYGITKPTLDLFNVKPLENFILQRNDTKITYICTEDNPAYAYVPRKELGIGGYKRKIYSPFASADRKWFNSLPKGTHLALPTLPAYGETLVIETSLKDTMANYELFNEEDIWFLDLTSESSFLSESGYSNLLGRFKYILYHGDNDLTGRNQALKFGQQFNLPVFWNPPFKELKDSSDMRHNAGASFAYNFIKQNINRLCKQIG